MREPRFQKLDECIAAAKQRGDTALDLRDIDLDLTNAPIAADTTDPGVKFTGLQARAIENHEPRTK